MINQLQVQKRHKINWTWLDTVGNRTSSKTHRVWEAQPVWQQKKYNNTVNVFQQQKCQI